MMAEVVQVNNAIDSSLNVNDNDNVNIRQHRRNNNNNNRRQREERRLNRSQVSPPRFGGGQSESQFLDGTRNQSFHDSSLQDGIEEDGRGDSIHQWSDWIRTRSIPRQPQINNSSSMRSSSASCERLAGRGQHFDNMNVTTHNLQSGLIRQ